MTKDQWVALCSFREEFKRYCLIWKQRAESLTIADLQSEQAQKDGVPYYPIENCVVYNTALDIITESDTIKLIIIGDNPGKDEQLHKNKAYLVGLSGKIANNFFKKHPELTIDFRSEVIILNKTPVHTAKTKELKQLASANPEIHQLIDETQVWMAKKTAELHMQLGCPLWLVGYAELKGKGIFSLYRDTFKKAYALDSSLAVSKESRLCFNNVYVYQHFSMNRFTIDLFTNAEPEQPLQDLLAYKGSLHREELFS